MSAAILLSTFLIFFPGFFFAQPDHSSEFIPADSEATLPPTFAIPNFVNNCAELEFCGRYLPFGTTRVEFTFRSGLDADSPVISTESITLDSPVSAPQTDETGPCFTISTPGKRGELRFYNEFNQLIFFESEAGLTSSIFRILPPLPDFIVQVPPYRIWLCSKGEPGLDERDVPIRVNRCIGTASWSSTVTPYTNSNPNGLSVTLSDPVAGNVFVPSTIVAKFKQLLREGGTYRVRISATETLSGVTRSSNILTTTVPICYYGPCIGCKNSFSDYENELLDKAFKGQLSDDEWIDFNIDALAERYTVASMAESSVAKNAAALTEPSKQSFTEIDKTTVYPNPAQDQINISYPKQPASVRLVSITGKTMTTLLPEQLSKGRSSLDVAEYATGMYLLEVIQADGSREVLKVKIAR